MRADDAGEIPPAFAPPARTHTLLLFLLALLGRAHLFVAPDALYLGWRQADMLSVARNFARHGYRLFWPQIDWGGAGPGLVEMELPILPWLGALLQTVLGASPYVVALLPLVASFGLVFAIAALARRVLGDAAGFWAGAFAALSPETSWATASLQPDGTMLFASVLGVLFLARWVESEKWSDFAISAAATSLAILLKPTAAFAGLPLLFLFYGRWGRSVLRRPAFWLYGLVALAPSVLWYVHAHALFTAYGNTFGVVGGGYGKLSSVGLLVSPRFWVRVLGRTAAYLLTPLVAVLWVFGVTLRPLGRLGRLFHVWTLSEILYLLLVGRGNFEMAHYQLPLLPPAAALAGAAVVEIARRLGDSPRGRRLRLAALALLAFTLAGAWAVNARRVVLDSIVDARKLRANGREVARVTPPGSLILVTTGYGGSRPATEIDTPPEVFSHADRKGWFVSLHWLKPEVVAARKAEGARALVVPYDALPFFTGPEADALKTLYPALPTAPGVLVLDLDTPPSHQPR